MFLSEASPFCKNSKDNDHFILMQKSEWASTYLSIKLKAALILAEQSRSQGTSLWNELGLVAQE